MSKPRQRLSLPHVTIDQFQIGDLVWARSRSSDPFWPVRGRDMFARSETLLHRRPTLCAPS